MIVYGFGLIKGLSITLKKFFEKKITQKYPEVKPKLPARSHGSFDFIPEKCISCNICANVCPNGVIKVESSLNDKGKKVLDTYRMSLSYCMFCGLCIEACPTAALNSKTDFETAAFGKKSSCVSWKGIVKKNDAASAAHPESESIPERREM
jgi:NADH-quinone oxidoreductase subunit I